MIYKIIWISVLFALASSAPKDDLIVELPGQNVTAANFKQYSGFLNGHPGVKLHYWFVESSHNAVSDPMVLWMNGGPGCSSLDGLLNELGPFLLNDDGKSFHENKYSWNTVANVLFLESPSCVGFSYNESGICHNGDISTAENNYLALKDFFTKFPEYRKNEFFITGESYAGVYVPTLSLKVLDGMDSFPLNFIGYAIGNGLGSYALNSDSIIFFAYYHGLFGDRLWHNIGRECCRNGFISPSTCNFYKSPYPQCNKALQSALSIIYNTGINMYNMYADCIPPIKSSRYHMDLNNIFYGDETMKSTVQKLVNRQNDELQLDPPCTSGVAMRAYLNSNDVRAALHIPKSVGKWDVCSEQVNTNYVRDYKDMTPQHKQLLQHVRGFIYNGDVDMACNFLGDEWLTEKLGLYALKERRPWYDNHQVGGFVKELYNVSIISGSDYPRPNLIFTTIRGSGHMVPQDKPSPALKMFKSFLFNKPL